MGKQIRISNTEIMSRIFATRVTGTITLPAQTGNLKKFACTNITVVATSKDLGPHFPNEFGQPKWVRTGKAKMIAGQCTYSINVPAFSQFYLTASGHGRGFACAWIDVSLTPTGAALGPFIVVLGAEKRVDLRVMKVTCIEPPH